MRGPRRGARLLGLSGLLMCVVAYSPLARAQSLDSPKPPAYPNAPLEPVDRRAWSIDSRTGCWIWTGSPQPNEIVTWTGDCGLGGRASGPGTVERRYAGQLERFDGVLRQGKADGQGVLTLPNGDRYVGEFHDGMANGQGVATYADRRRYEGDFRNGVANGHGVSTYADGRRYEGDFRDGAPNGHGIETYRNGDRYEGEFRDGRLNGHVVATLANGTSYVGAFRDNKANGHGVATFADGRHYDGEFRNDKFNGRGVLTSANGLRYDGWFYDGETGLGFDIDVSRYTGWLIKRTPEVGGWNVGFLLLAIVFAVPLVAGFFFLIRWLLFLPGDRGELEPKERRRVAVLAALGSSFAFMLVATVIYFLSLRLSEALFELFTIAVVALGLIVFLDPLFERFQEALGIPGHDSTGDSRRLRRTLLGKIAFALLLLNGVLHSLLHEFIKEYPGLSTVLIAGYGPIWTVITTYCWMLGWHPDRSRSRAALRGAVSGLLAGAIMAWLWIPYLQGIGKLFVPLLGVAVMTLVPLAGGLAMDRGWCWGLGRELRASLSMMIAMLAAWSVAGGLYWLCVYGFEENLWRAFVTVGLPIPAPSFIIPPEPNAPVHPSFLLLSGPAGVVGWGLGLFLSGRFDTLLMQRRLQSAGQSVQD